MCGADAEPQENPRERIERALSALVHVLRKVEGFAHHLYVAGHEAHTAFRLLECEAKHRADEFEADRADVDAAVLPHLRAGREIAALVRSGIDGCDAVSAWYEEMGWAIDRLDEVCGAADALVERTRTAQADYAGSVATAESVRTTAMMLTQDASRDAAMVQRVQHLDAYLAAPEIAIVHGRLAGHGERLPRSTDLVQRCRTLASAGRDDDARTYGSLAGAVEGLERLASAWWACHHEFRQVLGLPEDATPFWGRRTE